MARVPALLFAVLVVVALVQALWQHPQLPETVAAHFDASGRANGWMPRATHTALHVGLIIFIAGLLEGIARLNRRLPDEFINIPHREHWLAPARREETHAWLVGLIRVTACLVLLFLIGLFHQVYRANLSEQALTTSTSLLIVTLLVGIAGILVACLLRFMRVPR